MDHANLTKGIPEKKHQAWEKLLGAVETCRKCPLCQGRTRVVFGDGAMNTRLVFVGEAPGAEEDEQGIPFVGKAGQLLTRIFEAAGIDRKDIYITNVVKCRPPGNRVPSIEEMLACEDFFKIPDSPYKSFCHCLPGGNSDQVDPQDKRKHLQDKGQVVRLEGNKSHAHVSSEFSPQEPVQKER